MIHHLSYVFLQDLSNSFHRWFNLFQFSSRGISTIHGGVSHRHSQHLKTEEEFLLNLGSFPWRFIVLAQGHFFIIVLILRIPFTCLESIYSGLFILSFQLSFSNHTGAPLNLSLLAIHLECWRYLGRLVFPFSIRSRYFEVVISFKSFNSTGAIPPFN